MKQSVDLMDKKLSIAKILPSPAASGLSLRLNFSWTFFGNIIYAACQWGMLVVLARLGSPEMVGQFALGLAVTAPVIMFSNLQLRSVQASDARSEYAFADYLGLRLITTVLALLFIIGISLVSGNARETALVILIIGIAKALEAISDIYYGLLQSQERMDRVAQSKIIKGPASLLLMGAGVFVTGSVLWGAIGLVVAWAAVLLIYDMRSARLILARTTASADSSQAEAPAPSRLLPRFDRSRLLQLTWTALPLGFVMMLISLNVNVPRYFVGGYLGEDQLGVFAALSSLMVAGGIVVSALGTAVTPRLARYYAGGNNAAFWSLLLKLLGVGVLLGISMISVTAMFGREILLLIYGDPTYAQESLFVAVTVATTISFLASFLSYSMTAARYFRAQMPLFMAVTGSMALACFWLVPAYGLFGAAVALLIAALVQFGLSMAVIVYVLQRNVNTGKETTP